MYAHVYVYVYIQVKINNQTFADFCVSSIVSTGAMKAFRTKLAEEILHFSLPSIYIQSSFE